MSGTPFTWTKAGLQLEIGFRDFEHLAAPFSPSRQVSRSAGTIRFTLRDRDTLTRLGLRGERNAEPTRRPKPSSVLA
jgi:hypothetical protein